jgi:UDP-N-acetylmuramate dehydrogenase
LPPEAPRWQQSDGSIKTSAAWLIEHAGFKKGESRGNAGISPKHVLALTNNGGASAMAIVELAMEIRDVVRNKYGISLQPEVKIIGIKFI